MLSLFVGMVSWKNGIIRIKIIAPMTVMMKQQDAFNNCWRRDGTSIICVHKKIAQMGHSKLGCILVTTFISRVTDMSWDCLKNIIHFPWSSYFHFLLSVYFNWLCRLRRMKRCRTRPFLSPACGKRADDSTAVAPPNRRRGRRPFRTASIRPIWGKPPATEPTFAVEWSTVNLKCFERCLFAGVSYLAVGQSSYHQRRHETGHRTHRRRDTVDDTGVIGWQVQVIDHITRIQGTLEADGQSQQNHRHRCIAADVRDDN